MKIAELYTYTWGSFDVEVELRITGDHEVEVSDIFGVKDASGEWVDTSLGKAAVMQKAINETLETEGDAGEWDEVIGETRLDAQEDEPEPTWGHGYWVPRANSMPGAHRVH